jgi:isoquinoline 1-oxidoreductase alpha subunit
MAFDFNVNGKGAHSNAPPQTPLLWVIREELKLTGTKFGCGSAPARVADDARTGEAGAGVS